MHAPFRCPPLVASGLICVLALLCSFPDRATARPITFAFEGIVENVVDSSYTIYPDYVDYGDTFSGTYTFESTTPATRVDGWQNDYLDPILSIQGIVGDVAFSESLPITSYIRVVNDLPQGVLHKLDSYGMAATIDLFGHPTKFQIALEDYTATALSSKALPETPPQHESLMFRFQWLDSGTGIDGSVTSFTLVPEPGGLAMPVLGATAALARRRRQCAGAMIVVGLAACIASAPAQARPITFYFEGVVYAVIDESNTMYPYFVDYGSPLIGSFTFESETPASPVDPWQCNYFGAVTSLEGQVGGLTFAESPPVESNIELVNDVHPNPLGTRKQDSYVMSATIQLFGRTTNMWLGFIDYQGNVLSSTALPLSPPQFNDIQCQFVTDYSQMIRAQITSFTPEPGGIAMILLGVTAVIARRRSSRRS